MVSLTLTLLIYKYPLFATFISDDHDGSDWICGPTAHEVMPSVIHTCITLPVTTVPPALSDVHGHIMTHSEHIPHLVINFFSICDQVVGLFLQIFVILF